MHHPHVYRVVPGGGLSPDGSRRIAGRPNFLLAVEPLSRLFRRLFLERLQAAFDAKCLGSFNDLAHLADPSAFVAYLAAAHRVDLEPNPKVSGVCDSGVVHGLLRKVEEPVIRHVDQGTS